MYEDLESPPQLGWTIHRIPLPCRGRLRHTGQIVSDCGPHVDFRHPILPFEPDDPHGHSAATSGDLTAKVNRSGFFSRCFDEVRLQQLDGTEDVGAMGGEAALDEAELDDEIFTCRQTAASGY